MPEGHRRRVHDLGRLRGRHAGDVTATIGPAAYPWSIPTAGQVLTIHGRTPVADRTHIGCAEFKN
jgi:hypothetical protein